MGDTVFRSTSPSLLNHGRPGEIQECPVGLVLREAPYLYKAIGAQACVENGSLNPFRTPTWLQDAVRVVSSERARLREETASRRASNGDADLARKVVGRG